MITARRWSTLSESETTTQDRNLQHRNYKKYESQMRGHSYRKRCVVVYKWIELVLEEWRGYVATRGQDWTRDTEEGRQEIESLAKATKTLRPLQDQLKHRVRESVMGLADQ